MPLAHARGIQTAGKRALQPRPVLHAVGFDLRELVLCLPALGIERLKPPFGCIDPVSRQVDQRLQRKAAAHAANSAARALRDWA